jgi:hypothetical protein
MLFFVLHYFFSFRHGLKLPPVATEGSNRHIFFG